jgi:hypothetical protein
MRKQAVVLIHGIGEQRPMDTLRSFVSEVWLKNTAAQRTTGSQRNGLWSKPYPMAENFEMRRLTTAENADGVRTDFFEFYWQHLMHGTRYSHVISWARTLLFRWPTSVPRSLIQAYVILWAMLAAGCYLVIDPPAFFSWTEPSVASGWLGHPWIQHATRWLFSPGVRSLLAALIFMPLFGWLTLKVIGDAARYLNVAPENVKMRQRIRAAGLKVLKALHEEDYDRIIVAGHSLGAVIGYDILSIAWSEENTQPGSQLAPGSAVHRVDDLANELADTGSLNLDLFQAAQRLALREWQVSGRKWRVSDFVTMGSPLAHSAILLAHDLKGLQQKCREREFPTCPPTLERDDGQKRGSFLYFRPQLSQSVPHHAAVFAFTRWTNIYFPCRGIIFGDLIGGPVGGVFGAGIRDVAVHTRRWFGFLSHTFYWEAALSRDTHVDALLKAVDLRDGHS